MRSWELPALMPFLLLTSGIDIHTTGCKTQLTTMLGWPDILREGEFLCQASALAETLEKGLSLPTIPNGNPS